MTEVIKYALILHVLLGVIGVIAFYAVWMGLIKRRLNLKFLRYTSMLAFVMIILSWITAAYYYVVYYGGNVKPIIKAGEFPWAHLVVTETKEHVFIFLPFMALVIVFLIWYFGDDFDKNPKLKKLTAWLVAVTFFIGVFVTLAGAIISGAVR